MQYIVSYIVERYLTTEDGGIYKPEGHTLVAYANNKVEAFISAYAELTTQGHLVCTAGEEFHYVSSDENGLPTTTTSFRGLAGLTSDEMTMLYKAGVPKNRPGYDRTAMTHVESIQEFPFSGHAPVSKPAGTQGVEYISASRLDELRAVNSTKFDYAKLIRLCEEINICYSNDCLLAVAVLTRALLDHVPPIFGHNSFVEVVSNYRGTRSFKEQMEHLHTSARKVADAHLHTPVRTKESLPNPTQVNFASDLDVLLAEIVRISV